MDFFFFFLNRYINSWRRIREDKASADRWESRQSGNIGENTCILRAVF